MQFISLNKLTSMVSLSFLDYLIIFVFFSIVLCIGLYVSKSSGKSSSEYFLSGRSMPWWLLGVSMVATTFSTDTPNLVTDIVRTNGVSGNWVWWAFLLTGMLTVFVYARLWRRSNVNTDMEFYELRYGGPAARFLRGFRSIYLGVVFNVITMSAVTLAAIKIGGIMLGLEPWETVVIGGIVTVVYCAVRGIEGVVYTASLLFSVAMGGATATTGNLVSIPRGGILGSVRGVARLARQHPGGGPGGGGLPWCGQGQALPAAGRGRPPGGDRRFGDPAGGTVVELLVSGGRARWGGLHSPAHALGQEREARDRGHLLLQHHALRPAPLAVDPGRPGLLGGLSGP